MLSFTTKLKSVCCYGFIWTYGDPPPHVDNLSKVIMVHDNYEGRTFTMKNQGISMLLGK